jgi:hypothetical protein
MSASYGVVWRENEGPLGRGKLELLARTFRLTGVARGKATSREVPYDELSLVRVGRAKGDRLSGRRTLMLTRRDGETISIASVAEPGAIGELADRLAVLQAGHRIAVVLPLRRGAHEAVRELLVDGPPFDPDEIGLDCHQVYLTADEVVFVFESRSDLSILQPLLAEAAIWEQAEAWREHLAGPPRIAEAVYAWSRPVGRPDESLLPPGLRNGHGEAV